MCVLQSTSSYSYFISPGVVILKIAYILYKYVERLSVNAFTTKLYLPIVNLSALQGRGLFASTNYQTTQFKQGKTSFNELLHVIQS